MDHKVFGVFEHKVLRPHNPLVRGFDEYFYAPHSRHTEVLREDIQNEPALRILADSQEVGPHIHGKRTTDLCNGSPGVR